MPRLKQPCSVGSTTEFARRSTSTPSILMATSAEPIPAPKAKSPAVTSGAEASSAPPPMTAVLATTSRLPIPMTGRVPNLPTRVPEQRMPIMEPADRPKSTSPIWAVDAPNWSLMSGVRVTHDEIDSPGRPPRPALRRCPRL
ncbi:hypothetical protein SSPO_084180 [Streptomyces antimycoticus]|uniref:Uncharacterized protein n=1 Tax=Streptomyces antimycoticus TaxID=68175 RepID=A0A499UYC8_9ACTN|nr:hypothetical protein SSPO_084180 [Streptomyces antimycoticus]